MSMVAATGAAVFVVALLWTGRCVLRWRDEGRVWRRISGATEGSPRAGTTSFTAPSVVTRWCSGSLPEHEPGSVWRGWLAATAVAGAGGLLVAGPSGALFGAAIWVVITGAGLWCLRDRATRLGDAALVVWIDESSRAVRSGSSLAQAVADGERAVRGTPLESLAARVATHARRGELESGLRELTADGDSEARRLVRRALGVASVAGGPAGRLLDGVAGSLRDRAALRQEIHALGTQARASAVVIGVAPLAFFVVTTATDSRVASFVFGSPAGLLCLAVGVLLDVGGAAWMARLVRGVS